MPAPVSYSRSAAPRDTSPARSPMGGQGFLNGSYGAHTQIEDDLLDFESHECRIEADFCKNFSCCGLILPDLHDLLRHYEHQHVEIEEESLISASMSTDIAPPQVPSGRPRFDSDEMIEMKRNAKRDLQYRLGQSDSQSSIASDDEVAFDNYAQHHDCFQSRKRAWGPSMSSPSVSTRDFFTPADSPQSTPASSIPSTPTMPASHDFSGELENPLLFGPPCNSDDWMVTGGRSPIAQMKKKVRQQMPTHQGYTTPEMMSPPQVIEHPGSNLVVVDKPYKCPVPGCDKAYKNQNGLKYHKMHGNCAANPLAYAAAQASGQPVSYMVHENKPYSCTLCAKRYKNLNGLKYHTTHSHQHVTTDSVLKAIQESSNSQPQAGW